MKKKLISVILPTYNETDNIIPLLKELSNVLKAYTHELIVVDDNSSDGTYLKVKNHARENKNIRCILHAGEPELGGSILEGINNSQGEIIIGMDADLNHNPKLIPILIDQLKNHDIAIASRFIPGGGMRNKFRYFTSFGFNLLLKLCFAFPILDNTSGFYAITKRKLLTLNIEFIYQGYGEYHLRLLKQAQKKHFLLGLS